MLLRLGLGRCAETSRPSLSKELRRRVLHRQFRESIQHGTHSSLASRMEGGAALVQSASVPGGHSDEMDDLEHHALVDACSSR